MTNEKDISDRYFFVRLGILKKNLDGQLKRNNSPVSRGGEANKNGHVRLQFHTKHEC